MSHLLSKIKNLAKMTNSTYVIVENDEPKMVIMNFDEYEKIVHKGFEKPQMIIKGNIHQDIINRAQQSLQKSQHASHPNEQEEQIREEVMEPIKQRQVKPDQQMQDIPRDIPQEFRDDEEFSPIQETQNIKSE